MNVLRRRCFRSLAWAVACFVLSATSQAADPAPLRMVVMDPLAAPNSCPCVKGYAQRDYDKLAEFLKKRTGYAVEVTYHDSLAAGLKEARAKRADLVIGKHSVVLADAKSLKLSLEPALSLTGKDGDVNMTGLVVVPKNDPAQSAADLKGYRIIFGPAYSDEKHSAAMMLLRDAGVTIATTPETCEACSDGAETILALGNGVRAATVISSYAAPLLEGCGKIEKGDLRVVATTAPVPFIEAFVASDLPEAVRAKLLAAMLESGDDIQLRRALETRRGFVELAGKKKSQ
jgi:ABC-type phosphate/phosphonate transport system substrate-binding protein